MNLLRKIILSVTINTIFSVVWHSLEVQSARPWTYRGVKRWSKTYPDCGGDNQSPIEINMYKVEAIEDEKITLSKFDATPKSVKGANDGHTLWLMFEYDDAAPTVSGGPLKDSYKLDHVVFRWDTESPNGGSEHYAGSIPYPMEMQAYFFKSDIDSFDEAMSEPDGVAAIGYLFMDESDDDPPPETPGLDKVASKLCELRRASVPVDLDPFPFSSLLQQEIGDPYFMGYLTYPGSLTFPPCTENVYWMISTKIHYIKKDQFEDIRDIIKLSGSDKRNARPTEPVGDRTVKIYDITSG